LLLFCGKSELRYGFEFFVRLNIDERKFIGVIYTVWIKLGFKRNTSSERNMAVFLAFVIIVFFLFQQSAAVKLNGGKVGINLHFHAAFLVVQHGSL